MGRIVGSSILAAGSMEACVDDGDKLQCAQRFVTTLTVENAQNRTESITAYRLRDFSQTDGTRVELEDSLSVTLAKSSIVLRYPLQYERTYNADPRELILVRDGQGRDYNWLTNPCKDGTAADAACGSYVDPSTGRTVPYSQGFCCRCDFGDYMSGGPVGLSRANLQCSLLSTELAQSAHCLRWGPLWYRAFSLGPPVVHFVIEAEIKFCPGRSECRTRTYYLSPSSNGLCVVLPGLASDEDHPCDIQLSLEGDLASYEGAKSFASSLLMRPHSCDDFAACGAQVTESPSRWLMVPRSYTTQGSHCDRIGVSHEAFAGQPQRCGMDINSCLKQQLSDLYAADVEAEAAGRKPSYFVSSHGYGGRFAVDDSDPSKTMALFETARLQRSLVAVQVSADRLRYTVLVAQAVIVSAAVAPFEAKSGAGVLRVRIQSVGRVQAQFSLSVPDVPRQEFVRPANQESLTPAQLAEDVPRSLMAKDPNLRSNIVCYSFADNAFKHIPGGGGDDSVVFHFVMEGCLLHKDGDEAASQLAAEKSVREDLRARRRALEARAQEAGKTVAEVEEEEGDAGGRNQFNFSERAAQTYAPLMRDRGISTAPPETLEFGATASRWEAYDCYRAEFERLKSEEESGGLARPVLRPEERGGEATVHSAACGWSLKLLERMVVQNAQDELFSDFRFWEDESDMYKPGGMGTLLPLWRFSDARAKRKMVTAVDTNPRYPDLVAVSYGSYDFMRQGTGVVAVYSLKNPAFPEFVYTMDSGAMCLAFSPAQPSLLAVGCYDGTVRVYDVRKGEDRPLYASDIRSGKHTDPVWGVRWQSDPMAKDATFVSISTDGRVASWVLSKNELQMETLVSLKLVQSAAGGGDGAAGSSPAGAGAASAAGAGGAGGAAAGGAAGAGMVVADDEGTLTGLAGGCCFDFNPFAPHLFLVGTEEGRLHKCSKAYTGQYLETYEGHSMAVYAVKWSPFHERVFLTCSADWTVKLWDHMTPRAVAVFDLETAVGDVAWAPYSSTVFAAVAANGKAYVFDLDVDKHDERCVQKIVKKAKLTHAAFSATDPILLVGDSSGHVNSLKLSPNLRRITDIPVPEVKKGEAAPQPPSRLEVEVGKLNAVMLAMDVRAAVPIDSVTGKTVAPAKAGAGAGAGAAAAVA
ncbi:hypothetical protein FNF27_04365 [Cafeteria roenbergensis]|uniref:Generative cell specific-1/HAP2 domain-containing protein n=2 Tax=Cafeteria roenbergensis TaxID=33653 RepID=A0A5A8EAB8_CAFRO|nr:hypothetical protein FNF27_04365 [Cafeteria roenbergensis]